MPRSAGTAGRSFWQGRTALLPSGLLSRVPLPVELVDAIASVLEREAQEPDLEARADLLSRTRSVLDQWMREELTTQGAVESLVNASEPKSGIARRTF
jgi:hypothetical protein